MSNSFIMAKEDIRYVIWRKKQNSYIKPENYEQTKKKKKKKIHLPVRAEKH